MKTQLDRPQKPRECKYCNVDGVHCDKHYEPAGENTWVYPCHIKEFDCPDFTPKTKEKDGSNRM